MIIIDKYKTVRLKVLKTLILSQLSKNDKQFLMRWSRPLQVVLSPGCEESVVHETSHGAGSNTSRHWSHQRGNLGTLEIISTSISTPPTSLTLVWASPTSFPATLFRPTSMITAPGLMMFLWTRPGTPGTRFMQDENTLYDWPMLPAAVTRRSAAETAELSWDTGVCLWHRVVVMSNPPFTESAPSRICIGRPTLWDLPTMTAFIPRVLSTQQC